jgi:hypothetical protein
MSNEEEIGITILGSGSPNDLLRIVIERYKITTQSLSKISGIEEEVISDLVKGRGDLSNLPDNIVMNFHTLVMMLAIGTSQVEADKRLMAIIEGLNLQFDISLESIALYAKLDKNDVQHFMEEPNSISYEKRFNLAVTSLFLQFLFKPPAL